MAPPTRLSSRAEGCGGLVGQYAVDRDLSALQSGVFNATLTSAETFVSMRLNE